MKFSEMAKPPYLTFARFLLLATLIFFWGINWPAMKIVLSEMSVWWFRAICLIVGGSGLLMVAFLSKNKVAVPRKNWGPLMICAFFGIFGWHLMTGYGVSLMPAGRASIIAFTMPIWAAILSSIVLKEEINRRKILSLILGTSGLAVLIGPDLYILKEAPIGASFMLGASISWALGTIAFKYFQWSTSTIALAGWQLVVSAVPLTIGAAILEELPDFTAFSDQALYVFAFTLTIPMIYCQWAFLKTVTIFPANVAAFSTLPIPLVGVVSSAIILNERVGWQEAIALVLISCALGGVLLSRLKTTV